MLNLQSNFRHKRAKQAGMAMGEYALIGTLVVGVCIFGFMTVGTNIKAYLLGFKGQMQQQTVKTQEAKVAVAQAVTAIEDQKALEEATLQAEGGSLKVDPSNPDALCSSNWCVEAPGLTGDYVYTAGSNGGRANSPTNVASNIYAQVAKIMEQQPGADPGLITFMTDMANRGHSLADAQYKMTSAGDYKGMKAGADGITQNLSEFKRMSQQLDQSMAQFPPDIQALLRDASRVIIGVGDSYDIDYTPRNGNNHVGYEHHAKKISLVHSKSNTICGNGGDQSKCKR